MDRSDFQYAVHFACFCRNNAPTKANRQRLSPAALYEGNDELKVSSRIFKAVLFCLDMCTCTKKSGASMSSTNMLLCSWVWTLPLAPSW